MKCSSCCRMKADVSDVLTIVYRDGNVRWIPPVNYLVRCRRADDDATNCTLKCVAFY